MRKKLEDRNVRKILRNGDSFGEELLNENELKTKFEFSELTLRFPPPVL